MGGQPTPSRRPVEPSTSGFAAATSAPDIDAAIDSVLLEEAELTIAEPPTVAQSPRPRRGVKIKADSLQARIAAENVYVRDDLRRILIVSSTLFAALAAGWFVLGVLDVLGLY
jgi:hypothetical protein